MRLNGGRVSERVTYIDHFAVSAIEDGYDFRVFADCVAVVLDFADDL